MKNIRAWCVMGLTVLGLALSGCGGSKDSSSGVTSVRFVNTTSTHPSMDFYVNSVLAAAGAAADTVSGYAVPASGGTTLQLNDAGSSAALSVIVPTLAANLHYALLAYETGGVLKVALLGEDYAAPSAATVQFRVYNAAADAGKLDVYITAANVDLSTITSPSFSFTTGSVPLASGLVAYSPGTYRVRVTGYGNKNDLRIDMPAVTLSDQQIGTVVLTPASGGVLLNGSMLVEQGDYTVARNTNARVRLAAAVSGGATVAASAGSTVIDAGSVAPAFGYYTLVPASSALNISVNGASVGAPATALTAGSDVTLLVHGNAGSATATLLVDDNRPPTDISSVKLRLINGLTGTTGALTFTANSALVAAAIQPGTASSYVSVQGSTSAMNLSFTSSLTPGLFYSDTTDILNPDNVFTVFVGGDISAHQLLVR